MGCQLIILDLTVFEDVGPRLIYMIEASVRVVGVAY